MSRVVPRTLDAQVFYPVSMIKPTSKSDKQIVRMTQRAGVVLPPTGLPDPIRTLRHPWRACHETSALCLDQWCGVLVSSRWPKECLRGGVGRSFKIDNEDYALVIVAHDSTTCYLKHVFAVALITQAAIVKLLPMINECCAVAVTSAAMDGVAPELNPGRVHRRNNSYSAARYAL